MGCLGPLIHAPRMPPNPKTPWGVIAAAAKDTATTQKRTSLNSQLQIKYLKI